MKYLVEYLPRINCVGVHIDEVQNVILEGMTQDILTLGYHSDILSDRKDVEIHLPKKIDVDENRGVSFVKGNTKSWSLRLKVDPKHNKHPIKTGFNSEEGNKLDKWDRKYLKSLETFLFRCEHCDAPILDNKVNCKVINEMPSDNWMELMDYWHCHKPDVHENQKGLASILNSSRYSSLKPLINEVLVGESSLNTNYDTIIGRVIQKDDTSLVCYNCACILGEVTGDNLCKLYKWKLKLFDVSNEDVQIYDPKNDIILMLLNYTKNYSGRYSILKCKGFPDIMLWIFAIDIGVTLGNNKIFPHALKILYITDKEEFIKISKNHNVEEFKVKELPFKTFLEDLKENHHSLPESAQQFTNWKISYLSLE